MLLWNLHRLHHQLMQALWSMRMKKAWPRKVLTPSFHSSGDSVQFADVCRGAKQFGTKFLVEESNWMATLH